MFGGMLVSLAACGDGGDKSGPTLTTDVDLAFLGDVSGLGCAGTPVRAVPFFGFAAIPDHDHLYVVELAGMSVDEHVLSAIDLSGDLPVRLGSTPLVGGALFTAFALDGERAVAGGFSLDDGSGVVQFVDLARPGAPSARGSLDLPGGAWSVALAGDHAWVADSSNGLAVVDVSDPAALETTATVDDGALALGAAAVAVLDDVVAAVSWAGEPPTLTLLDPADPSAPAVVREVPLDADATPRAVAVADGAVLVASWAEGERRLHVIDSATGDRLGELVVPIDPLNGFDAKLARLDAGTVVVGGSDGEPLVAIDLADPAAPEVVGGWEPVGPYVLSDVRTDGELVWVTGIFPTFAGAVALDFGGCAR